MTRIISLLNTGNARTDSIVLNRGRIYLVEWAVAILNATDTATYLTRIQLSLQSVSQFEINDAAGIISAIRSCQNMLATTTQSAFESSINKVVPCDVDIAVPRQIYVHSSLAASLNGYIDCVIHMRTY